MKFYFNSKDFITKFHVIKLFLLLAILYPVGLCSVILRIDLVKIKSSYLLSLADLITHHLIFYQSRLITTLSLYTKSVAISKNTYILFYKNVTI